MSPIDRITRAVRTQGLHTLTSNLLKQAGQPYPEHWDLKTAALTVTLKMAQNRQSEASIRQGIASYMKAVVT